ncbi:OmpL47-type beta-barrel domain-containing protein [Paenibacillus allorhizosphaerae]|uniref:OmpL47-type beta-barrel domain-containing protein n=1 Tax=Paenibacillus allorhizosphaerae TaxID=2849866 RepID=UPI001C40672A|nr:carboxypeptidase regulatory-like domain-containing protein [Paenibacillus allorhizosphaerae]
MFPFVALAEPEKPQPKETPFPPIHNSIAALALPNGQIANEHIQALIGSSGRFNMGIKDLSAADRWYNIIYNWPSAPNTSFTTVKVDGADRVFGQDGAFTSAPHNVDDSTNEAIWKFGDISVKQALQTGINPATGIPDAVKIRYTMTNTGTQNHNVGLRMMIDTMVNGNDSAPFRVPAASGGIESVNTEKNYLNDQVPAFWQAFNNFNNPDISSQYTMRGNGATPPDRFTIANWNSIQATQWDYTITPNRQTGDSAVGMWWNPETLAPGETKTITTYYGRPGVGGNQTLVLSGRQRLSYPEWSASPLNLIAYLNNNLGSTLNNVTVKLVPSSGLTLVDGDAVHTVGNLAVGANAQTTWRVKPTAEGIHQLTVNAYRDGAADPFATATYQIEALAPVVPPNVSLGGDRGNQNDGTPIAGRTSPLTVNASFNNPQASSVTLVAIDATGDRYQAEMHTTNGIDWTLTFTPSQVGLWETPLTIEITPHYPDRPDVTQHFEIVLIDPSGIVYNAERGDQTVWPLPGATVVLQYNDPELGAWVNMSEEAYPGRLDPITNPQTTGQDGRYAWDVAAGQYRVLVSRPGFQSATSRVVTVPPPVTDLHVGLTPTDRVAPTLQVNGVTEGATYTAPVTVQYSASDNEAGVRSVTYRLDAGAQQSAGTSGSFPVSAPGAHTVDFLVVDHAGNELAKQVKFTIAEPPDTVAPVSTLTANPAAPNGTNGWYTSNITVTFSAVDNVSGSGVDKIQYRMNGGTWNDYTVPVVLTADGSYNVEYFSKDHAGNSEAVKSVTLKLDKTAPVTRYNLAPLSSVSPSGKTYISGFKVTLTPSDNASTVTGTVYRINGSAWSPYTGAFDIQAATTQTVEYYSTDGAGNKEKFNLMDFIRGIFTGNQ